eukprot:3884612-Prymnesium_polylepis.2
MPNAAHGTQTLWERQQHAADIILAEAAPRAIAVRRDKITTAAAPCSASQRDVSSPSPPVPPLSTCIPHTRGALVSSRFNAIASRGIRTEPRSNMISGSSRDVKASSRRHSQVAVATMSAQTKLDSGASCRAALAKPHNSAPCPPRQAPVDTIESFVGVSP